MGRPVSFGCDLWCCFQCMQRSVRIGQPIPTDFPQSDATQAGCRSEILRNIELTAKNPSQVQAVYAALYVSTQLNGRRFRNLVCAFPGLNVAS